MEDAFWAFVDQKWRDSLNVAAAEPAGWDQGADYPKGAEATRRGEQDRQALRKAPPGGVHVATVDSARAAPQQGPQEVQVCRTGRALWLPPPVIVQSLQRQDSRGEGQGYHRQ
jgi:hypothetical protein